MMMNRMLPKSLFTRALLILVLPMLLTQLLLADVFFDRHWSNVMRYLSHSVAGEIAFLVGQLEEYGAREHDEIIAQFQRAILMQVSILPASDYQPEHTSKEFSVFQEILASKINRPFTLNRIDDGETIEVRVKMKHRVLAITTTAKRLESRTTEIYIFWMIGTSLLFILIAVMFLRNQIRPIRLLAEAANSFGRGVDMPGFRPRGATEVRKASLAFIVMRERIKRQIRTRTEMLAGISHDLRTPLTRMKLQLAMLKEDEAIAELKDDVLQMEHMIQEYLDFARGDGGEDAIHVNIKDIVKDVVSDYGRLGSPVILGDSQDVQADVKVIALRRVLHNIIDNALRYGKHAVVLVQRTASYVEIVIEDDGPGIPKDKREEVFKPFSRLDLSRNSKTGGAGLGLSIARDIVRAHGGGILLQDRPHGGLRVVIKIPLQQQ